MERLDAYIQQFPKDGPPVFVKLPVHLAESEAARSAGSGPEAVQRTGEVREVPAGTGVGASRSDCVSVWREARGPAQQELGF